MVSVLGKIVGLAIAAIFLGTIFVAGMQSLNTANTSSFTATQVVVYAVLGVIVILAAVILVLEYVGVRL